MPVVGLTPPCPGIAAWVGRLGAQPVAEGDLIRAPEQFSGSWSELYGEIIGELGVLPILRPAPRDTLLAACGTSCRHQIADLASRKARHLVRLLDEASAPR